MEVFPICWRMRCPPPGTRGVVVDIGHLQENPERKRFLVHFEDADLNLGPPTGCWPEELSAEAAE